MAWTFYSRLRHPNILLLMAQCHTKQDPGLALVFERVYVGSLYQFMYCQVLFSLVKHFSPIAPVVIVTQYCFCVSLNFIIRIDDIHVHVAQMRLL